MQLTFSNGYTISIIDKNEYILIPEVGYWRSDDDEPMQVERFQTADELTDILNKVRNHE